jgi:hypothetical protein
MASLPGRDPVSDYLLTPQNGDARGDRLPAGARRRGRDRSRRAGRRPADRLGRAAAELQRDGARQQTAAVAEIVLTERLLRA